MDTMFAYRILVRAARADGDMGPEEKDALVQFAGRLALNADDVREVFFGPNRHDPIEPPEDFDAREEALRALVGMLQVPSGWSGAERVVLQRAGALLRVEPDVVDVLVG